ncbi:L,D-peptidoglycan transpeptidase YkuD, ErfK/YbiS/YcfS/YnhG family [Micromonospora rhizosphaerae]|uniref:L,D-peptidoglycan transpeptidase YkuD, ErfK/YbiS/YcfS/YnhG family n=1 Tax=Micromonospora rhizosphaerae TaxID=568872 RepID=A0A1C6T5Q0_9ACTN|nr:L,D-transpeptidase family protein [Micromonospora rhizosphaerae]SCL36745.1 L,D-peptidoglycan transpeptidase YkuD, ErfK/YbiS/YcfS/YnhG family [Micromonospora rhizosphaerae]
MERESLDSGPGPSTASRLTRLPPHTDQLVVVTGDGWRTSHATLETFVRTGSRWDAVAVLPAWIGADGFSDAHVEGVPTTPTGVFAFGPTMYGISPDPGVRFPYHLLGPDHWWNANPDSSAYNTFQHTGTNPGGESEALWREVPAYTHLAVIAYNMPPTVAAPVPYAGSGIFLHEFSRPGGNATAGCVALSHDDLVGVLRWLDPAASPRIVLAPRQHLGRY